MWNTLKILWLRFTISKIPFLRPNHWISHGYEDLIFGHHHNETSILQDSFKSSISKPVNESVTTHIKISMPSIPPPLFVMISDLTETFGIINYSLKSFFPFLYHLPVYLSKSRAFLKFVWANFVTALQRRFTSFCMIITGTASPGWDQPHSSFWFTF